MGGAGHKMAHNVFIWDKAFGALQKVLEGPKESLIDCDVGQLSDVRLKADTSVAPDETGHCFGCDFG